MKRLMEYKIISGRVQETRRCWLDTSDRSEVSRRPRAPRKAGTSSKRKIIANENQSVRELARLINCNFGTGDLWLTLKYADERLPVDMDAAKVEIEKFLRKCRAAYKAETGKKLRYVLCTSHTSSSDGSPVRLHHHVVMDSLCYDIICRYWPAAEISYRIIDGRGDYTGIARYMVQNADKLPNKKKWSCSKGLIKPIYTEPVPVSGVEGIKTPAGAKITESMQHIDLESGLKSSYVRAVLPKAPRVRGGKVIYPKKR